MRAEVSRALVLHADEHVRRPPGRRPTRAVLVGVHTQVGRHEQLGRLESVFADDDGAVRGRDREPFTALRQCARTQETPAASSPPRRGEHAELVAPEPVRGAPVDGRLGELGGKPVQERVPGKVAEGVVVRLEAVEVVEDEAEPLAGGGSLAGDFEVAEELPSVADAGEHVGVRGFVSARREPGS